MRRLLPTAVALALAGIAAWAVIATPAMGYSRDESFYFRFAEVYQDWFRDALDWDGSASSEASPFSRARLLQTWNQNLEHPPLVKVAMGAAWRGFARRERPIRVQPGSGTPGVAPLRVRVDELRASHGFDVGDEVEVLAPQGIEQPDDDPARWLASGRVVERKSGRATVEVPPGSAVRVIDACKSTVARREQIRGCTAAFGGPLREGSAMRLPGAIFTAVLVFAMALFGWATLHPAVGILAPLLFLSVPRWFYHAHLAAFDMPIAAVLFCVCAAFWVSLRRPAWSLAAGVIWGLALLTKHNALFAPVPLVAFWLIDGRSEIGASLGRRPWVRALAAACLGLAVLWLGRRAPVWAALVAFVLATGVLRLRLRMPRIPLAFLVMPPIGITMLFALWPKLWVDPFRSVELWIRFHLKHEHYLQYYFGRVLEVPPFPVDFPFTMTLLTVPALVLAMGAIGALDMAAPWVRDQWARARTAAPPRWTPALLERRRLALFLALNALFPVVLIALPSTPIFGGVKHWMTGMPFGCLIAAWGVWRLAVSISVALNLRAASARGWLAFALGVLVLAPSVTASARTVRGGNAHYAELAGGVSGAADRKLTRLYWGHSSVQVFEWLNRNAPLHARVWFHDTTYDAFWMYRREGRIRRDIRFARSVPASDIALFEEQKFFAATKLDLERAYGVPGPAKIWSLEGVPILSAWARPRDKAPSPALPRRRRPAKQDLSDEPSQPEGEVRDGGARRGPRPSVPSFPDIDVPAPSLPTPPTPGSAPRGRSSAGASPSAPPAPSPSPTTPAPSADP